MYLIYPVIFLWISLFSAKNGTEMFMTVLIILSEYGLFVFLFYMAWNLIGSFNGMLTGMFRFIKKNIKFSKIDIKNMEISNLLWEFCNEVFLKNDDEVKNKDESDDQNEKCNCQSFIQNFTQKIMLD